MIYKGNKPLILSLNNGNSKVSRMFKGNQSIYANAVYFPQAIGGTIFRNDEYNIHIFTNTDTFQPIVAGDYEIFLVGPGGAGAGEGAFDFYPGGGGAGGQILQNTYTLSPTTYNLVFTVNNTQFDSIVSVEKGLDAVSSIDFDGADYVAYGGATTFTGGAGFNGGDSSNSGGGGAGANENGANAFAGSGGRGGDGYYVDWLLGIDVEGTLPGWDNYVSGGGAGASNSGGNIGGLGGGGNAYPSTPDRNGGPGRANSGGGGGGAGWNIGAPQYDGGAGGTGLCLVRYKRYY